MDSLSDTDGSATQQAKMTFQEKIGRFALKQATSRRLVDRAAFSRRAAPGIVEGSRQSPVNIRDTTTSAVSQSAKRNSENITVGAGSSVNETSPNAVEKRRKKDINGPKVTKASVIVSNGKEPHLVGFPAVTAKSLNLTEVEGDSALPAPHTLILGSMPSVKSLEYYQYYGHPQNSFWKIAGFAFGFDKDVTPYEQRLEILVRNGYVLWDVLYGCIRPGSLDSNIKHEKPNDIKGVLDENPSIHKIVINGKAAAGFFKKYFGHWVSSGLVQLENDAARSVLSKNARSQANTLSFAVLKKRERSIALYVMPSTSPAHASMSVDKKRKEWMDCCWNGHKDEVIAIEDNEVD